MERNLSYLCTGHLLCRTQRRKSSGFSMPHAPGHTGFCHRTLPHLPVWKWRWGPVSKHKARWHSSSFGEALLPLLAMGLFCKMNLPKTGNCIVHVESELLCPPLKGFWEPLSLFLMDTCLNYQPHKILWQHPNFPLAPLMMCWETSILPLLFFCLIFILSSSKFHDPTPQ